MPKKKINRSRTFGATPIYLWRGKPGDGAFRFPCPFKCFRSV